VLLLLRLWNAWLSSYCIGEERKYLFPGHGHYILFLFFFFSFFFDLLQRHVNVAFHGYFDATVGVVISLQWRYQGSIPSTPVGPLDHDGIVRFPRGGQLAAGLGQGPAVRQGKVTAGRNGGRNGIFGKGMAHGELFLLSVNLHAGGSVGVSHHGIGRASGQVERRIQTEGTTECVQALAQLDLVDCHRWRNQVCVCVCV
jgi:hypothetical protein